MCKRRALQKRLPWWVRLAGGKMDTAISCNRFNPPSDEDLIAEADRLAKREIIPSGV